MSIDGRKIRAMREKCGLTRTKLSEKSGVKLETIHYWEKREQIPNCNLVQVLKIVKAMDCSLQDLVEDGQVLRLKNKKERQ